MRVFAYTSLNITEREYPEFLTPCSKSKRLRELNFKWRFKRAKGKIATIRVALPKQSFKLFSFAGQSYFYSGCLKNQQAKLCTIRVKERLLANAKDVWCAKRILSYDTALPAKRTKVSLEKVKESEKRLFNHLKTLHGKDDDVDSDESKKKKKYAMVGIYLWTRILHRRRGMYIEIKRKYDYPTVI